MTWEIALVLSLLVLTLALFVWEKVAPDLVALIMFVVLIATGLISQKEAFSVFSNTAPFTVAAMFVLSAALVKCGAIDRLSTLVERAGTWSFPAIMFAMVVVVGGLSAFVNNTPVVVVMLPVVLNLARKMKVAPSKLLIPLSYAAVLGGTCTLIGTSTNLVANGMMTARGIEGFSMFELGWVGIPATVLGAIYLAVAGNRLLPVREMLTSILSEEERREYITEAFVQDDSPMVGKNLKEAGLTTARGIRVLEIVRDGIGLYIEPSQVRLKPGDRLILACRLKGIVHTRGVRGIDLVSEMNLGLEQIAAHEGSLVEAVVNPHSSLVGQTVREVHFRQRFRMVVLALHRKGRNVREQVDTLPIEAGDVLLMMGTDQAIDALRQSDDLVLFDRARVPSSAMNKKIPLVVGVIAAVVVTASFEWVPIEIGALVGCLVLCVSGCLKSSEAYDAIEWNILILIYGMIAFGIAMERTGAAAWIAEHAVAGTAAVVPEAYRGLALLAAVYLVTTVLTEILSNNAVAAMMVPIVLGLAQELGVDPRGFLVIITFAASAAFATPIGYQTNTYVYGVGGYRFSDFLKVGIPLNILCFIVAMVVVPRIWPL
jgi:di/tricarboxylate transporter